MAVHLVLPREQGTNTGTFQEAGGQGHRGAASSRQGVQMPDEASHFREVVRKVTGLAGPGGLIAQKKNL
jgi:hypothetical protein